MKIADLASLLATGERLRAFHRALTEQGRADTYEAAHARLAAECLTTAHVRLSLLDQGKLKPLANPVSQAAADQLYLETVRKLAAGLGQALAAGEKSSDARKRLAARLWKRSALDAK